MDRPRRSSVSYGRKQDPQPRRRGRPKKNINDTGKGCWVENLINYVLEERDGEVTRDEVRKWLNGEDVVDRRKDQGLGSFVKFHTLLASAYGLFLYALISFITQIN